jgi:hypothetical protein
MIEKIEMRGGKHISLATEVTENLFTGQLMCGIIHLLLHRRKLPGIDLECPWHSDSR